MDFINDLYRELPTAEYKVHMGIEVFREEIMLKTIQMFFHDKEICCLGINPGVFINYLMQQDPTLTWYSSPKLQSEGVSDYYIVVAARGKQDDVSQQWSKYKGPIANNYIGNKEDFMEMQLTDEIAQKFGINILNPDQNLLQTENIYLHCSADKKFFSISVSDNEIIEHLLNSALDDISLQLQSKINWEHVWIDLKKYLLENYKVQIDLKKTLLKKYTIYVSIIASGGILDQKIVTIRDNIATYLKKMHLE